MDGQDLGFPGESQHLVLDAASEGPAQTSWARMPGDEAGLMIPQLMEINFGSGIKKH